MVIFYFRAARERYSRFSLNSVSPQQSKHQYHYLNNRQCRDPPVNLLIQIYPQRESLAWIRAKPAATEDEAQLTAAATAAMVLPLAIPYRTAGVLRTLRRQAAGIP